jgi:hypothetical protein
MLGKRTKPGKNPSLFAIHKPRIALATHVAKTNARKLKSPKRLTNICLVSPAKRDARLLPTMLAAEKTALEHSLASSTTENYARLVEKFINWARTLGFTDQEIQPASEDLVCVYIAQIVGTYGESHAKNIKHAIRAWNIQHGYAWHPSQRLDAIISGIRKAKPSGASKEKRPPVTLEMMKVLRQGLDLIRAEDACCWANACTAFWGSCRLGELLPKTVKGFELRKQPLLSDILIDSKDCITIHLPYTKTMQNNGEDSHIFRQNAPLDPLCAIRHHVARSQLAPGDMLASYRSEEGSLHTFSKDTFLKKCNAIWLANGVTRMTGHSFRIRGATVFLENGTESDVVKKLGRWKSDAALLYWRNLPRVLGQHAVCIASTAVIGHQEGASGAGMTIKIPPRRQRWARNKNAGGHSARVGGSNP